MSSKMNPVMIDMVILIRGIFIGLMIMGAKECFKLDFPVLGWVYTVMAVAYFFGQGYESYIKRNQ